MKPRKYHHITFEQKTPGRNPVITRFLVSERNYNVFLEMVKHPEKSVDKRWQALKKFISAYMLFTDKIDRHSGNEVLILMEDIEIGNTAERIDGG